MKGWRGTLHDATHAIEKRFDAVHAALHRKLGRDDPVHVVPFRGFAANGEVWTKGRVLEKEHEPASEGDSLWKNLVRMFRRYESDEVRGARVRLGFGGVETELETDREGYYEARLELPDAAELGLWSELDVELREPVDEPVRAKAEFVRPTARTEYLVVSDLDDTVVKTHATDFLQMARVVLLGNARTRLPFPGVSAFYQALAEGRGGASENPFFYVSSSPWNLYDLFVDFLAHHGLPKGPLFLKDFGIDENKFIKSDHDAYKRERIERLLDAYPQLPVLLVGDSGQSDPEIYQRIVRRDPERVIGVFLRDVASEARREEVSEVVASIERTGTLARLAPETETLARHAVEGDLLDEEQLARVREARTADEGRD